MSVDVGLELDWELLAGAMEAPHCESPHHLDTDSHDDGPATHYMLIGHCCFGPIGKIIPVCSRYVQHWAKHPPAPMCNWCNAPLQPEQLNQVIGPINS
jgi:hypothetical protein